MSRNQAHLEDIKAAKDLIATQHGDPHGIWRFVGALEGLAETQPALAAAMRRAAEITLKPRATA